MTILFTSESVTEGHPDKLCDKVSDAVLDACLAIDPCAKVACETATKDNFMMVLGEVTCNGDVDYKKIMTDVLQDVGYDDPVNGIDYRTFRSEVVINQQSADIAGGVHVGRSLEDMGAGDQGHMFGYATDETEELMPLTHVLASKLCEKLTQVRKSGELTWLRPDAKSQVSVEYLDEGGRMIPQRIHTVLISTQHAEDMDIKTIEREVMDKVIRPILPSGLIDKDTLYHINPAGRFVIGGPNGDAGLTGRKIIIDTYGGWGAHGGGAFSGKDPSKVDRSAAYASRWIAKSLVASRLAKRVLVQVSYAIGLKQPTSIHVDSYGTVKDGYSDSDLLNVINTNFDLSPGAIIKALDLQTPIYYKTAAYGHFGRDDVPWEVPKTVAFLHQENKGTSEKSEVADMNLADFGRKEIDLAEIEMPGLMNIRARHLVTKPLKGKRVAGSLHMTIQTAVLIETLADMGADIRWCSCNIYSTQDHAAAGVVAGGKATVFAWKGETLEEYWNCTQKALFWDDGEGPDLIVDDGSDATGLIHIGSRYETEYKLTGKLPSDEDATCEEETYMFRTISKSILEDSQRYTNASLKIIGVSEETTTGVHRLEEMARKGELLFPAININDSVTKTKFDNLYGCRHSCVDGIMRATDVMIAGKKVLVCGFGDVGKGSAQSMRAAGATVRIAEIDPICALQAAMEGYEVVIVEDVVSETNIFITATGNRDVITVAHMRKMRENAIVCNIGHFDNEIEVELLDAVEGIKIMNIKPQVDRYQFAEGNSIILLAKGRLMNLGCATGHPSFVMSCSFTNQVMAQLELLNAYINKVHQEPEVRILPKYLDEEVARLHLDYLGARLTKLNPTQATYINCDVDGPFKKETYKY